VRAAVKACASRLMAGLDRGTEGVCRCTQRQQSERLDRLDKMIDVGIQCRAQQNQITLQITLHFTPPWGYSKTHWHRP